MAHGDIKPDNVMFTDDLQGLTFIDFGHADEMGTVQKIEIGTEMYRAPEVSTTSRYLIDSTDIYSLGCTMFAIMFQNFPFHPKNIT